MKITVINGANLNMLGIREVNLYGKRDYNFLVDYVKGYARDNMVETDFFQSNHEGDIVDKIQSCFYEKVDGIIINPGAYTHTSIAILDALKSVCIPTVEVHITDVDSREEFRKISYVSLYAEKTVKGKGIEGYIDAMKYLIEKYGN